MSTQGRAKLLAIIGFVALVIVGMVVLAIAARSRRYARMPRVRLVLQAQPQAVFVLSAPELGALVTTQGEEDTYGQIARCLSKEAVGTEAVKQIALGSEEITIRTRVRDREDLARQGEAIRILLADAVPGAELRSSELIPITPQDLATVQRILHHRLREYGFAGPRPLVQVQHPDRVVVELRAPDSEKARKLQSASAELLLKTGLLEFPLIPRAYAHRDRGPEVQGLGHRHVFRDREGMEVPTSQVIAESPVVLTARDIAPHSARIVALPKQPTSVVFKLNQQAAETFEDFTRKNVGRYVAIVLDGEMITCPIIEGPIPGGDVSVSGGFDGPGGLERAQDLKILLNAGALPVDLECVESRIVEPPR